MSPVHRISAPVAALGLFLSSILARPALCHAQSAASLTVATLGSTVPSNGDLNPYGVALVPRTTGSLVKGRFLVSNFNNAANQQGRGTTIVQMQANGTQKLFAQIESSATSCPGGVGLTTALVALQNGYVVVGSLPTTNGMSASAEAGCLLILNSSGKVVKTISGYSINGPWDMAVADATDVDGDHTAKDVDDFVLFVTNVLNGTVAADGKVVDQGTVVRLQFTTPAGKAPELLNSTVIASGFPERTDPVALVIGPTGVAFDATSGDLFVVDTLNNRIASISSALTRTQSAGTGTTLSTGGDLNGPLGASLLGNDLFVTNGNDGRLVQIDVQTGKQVAAQYIDMSGTPPGAGALFGLWAISNNAVYFVDDATNTFNLAH